MQMSLFENNVEKLNLYKAVDDIKDRFGSKLVTKAVTSQTKDSANEFTTRHNKKKSAE
jgi:DNA polymerase-4